MSGYASKREAMEVLKHAITSGWNSLAPSDRTEDYYLERVFEDSFYYRGAGYGWGQINPSDAFHVTLARHLRPKAATRLLDQALADRRRFEEMRENPDLRPEGLTARDVGDLYHAATERVALLRDSGLA